MTGLVPGFTVGRRLSLVASPGETLVPSELFCFLCFNFLFTVGKRGEGEGDERLSGAGVGGCRDRGMQAEV